MADSRGPFRYVYRWHFYACMDGAIYEVNDWAECTGLHNKIKPNAHDVVVTCRDPKDQKPRTYGNFDIIWTLPHALDSISQLNSNPHGPCAVLF